MNLNKKQIKLLKAREKELNNSRFFCLITIVVGLLICLTLFGIPLGLILIIYSCYKFNKCGNERREIEFKLAG